ncbi:alpha-1A adrenergic receptor-like [Actinia tenebrosa]|uniref:Alpha-1A adrenergic receptor-like n=1 Tax=Actinia tenebrosa TaxID=6105 RepID=A0A6P8HU96_ACTTE|nr:alpha-1A adrenergic receptor-like [Actinia tenebrosa]XP_031558801.1 alpha-1A adrenergic receptor-like [Actinia tenebrosa]XP_031558802.1 alpha-1A adrenergic receptor-like [Actinia tenebrosa]XP_031558803.1 alpha-1A adrenergic receptor-like [Actinia tenebrosa]XP_031558805.1 alpha-1A adrenergic receptor-like [Actinia tenebrosa]XP_031558806.1 alpha-1A adrenergic receptor-like [Actinia tenebrosa]XP_031558807.1 alpha-1A adrenergic receptor-like [Actinia tenebrosa]
MNETNSGNVDSNASFRYPVPIQTAEAIISATFICVLIIFTLLANIFVCFATLRFDCIRPLTNYFIVNLCIADILIAVISMPVYVLVQVYGNNAIQILLGGKFLSFWGCMDIFCGTASILSLSCISVDRYLAITRPLKYVRCMTWRRGFVMIIAVWCYAGTVAFLRQPMTYNQNQRKVYALFVFAASFLLPLIVIVVSYSKIFCVAQKHARDIVRRSSISQEEKFKRVSRDLKAAKTISVVIGTFVCFWAPFIVVSVCYSFNVWVDFIFANIVKWLAYINALLNPLVYSCVDKQLRSLVIKIVVCKGRRDEEAQMPLRAV